MFLAPAYDPLQLGLGRNPPLSFDGRVKPRSVRAGTNPRLPLLQRRGTRQYADRIAVNLCNEGKCQFAGVSEPLHDAMLDGFRARLVLGVIFECSVVYFGYDAYVRRVFGSYLHAIHSWVRTYFHPRFFSILI